VYLLLFVASGIGDLANDGSTQMTPALPSLCTYQGLANLNFSSEHGVRIEGHAVMNGDTDGCKCRHLLVMIECSFISLLTNSSMVLMLEL
jgi:hypothetical protein